MLAILLLMTGHFAGSVYVRPFLEQITQLGTKPIALALLGFGVASVIGNVAGGRIADNQYPRCTRRHRRADGSLMVVSFQVAISIGAVVGGYIVNSHGATAPLALTAILAASTVALALLQRRD